MQFAKLPAKSPGFLRHLAEHRWVKLLQEPQLRPEIFHPFAPFMEAFRVRAGLEFAPAFPAAPISLPERGAKIFHLQILQRPALEAVTDLLQDCFGRVPFRAEMIRQGRNLLFKRVGGPGKSLAFEIGFRAQLFHHLQLDAGVARAGQGTRGIAQTPVFPAKNRAANFRPDETQKGADFRDVFAGRVDSGRFLLRGCAAQFEARLIQLFARHAADFAGERRAGLDTVRHETITAPPHYPAWIRTMNNASKGRCVTVTPRGIRAAATLFRTQIGIRKSPVDLAPVSLIAKPVYFCAR